MLRAETPGSQRDRVAPVSLRSVPCQGRRRKPPAGSVEAEQARGGGGCGAGGTGPRRKFVAGTGSPALECGFGPELELAAAPGLRADAVPPGFRGRGQVCRRGT